MPTSAATLFSFMLKSATAKHPHIVMKVSWILKLVNIPQPQNAD